MESQKILNRKEPIFVALLLGEYDIDDMDDYFSHSFRSIVTSFLPKIGLYYLRFTYYIFNFNIPNVTILSCLICALTFIVPFFDKFKKGSIISIHWRYSL